MPNNQKLISIKKNMTHWDIITTYVFYFREKLSVNSTSKLKKLKRTYLIT